MYFSIDLELKYFLNSIPLPFMRNISHFWNLQILLKTILFLFKTNNGILRHLLVSLAIHFQKDSSL